MYEKIFSSIFLIRLAEAPAMYGPFHIGAVFVCVTAAWLAARKAREKDAVTVFRVLGFLFLLLEICKQYMLYRDGSSGWWYFPFQLCSMPMYLTLAYAYLPERSRNTADCFLTSFCVTAALCAFLYPQDMLRDDLLLSLHAFLWHGMMLFAAFFLLLKKQVLPGTFRNAVKLLLLLSFIAEIINLAGFLLSAGTDRPDMFYISPFTHTGQPVFRQIEQTFGRAAEIIFYLAALSAASCLIHKAFLLLQETEKR